MYEMQVTFKLFNFNLKIISFIVQEVVPKPLVPKGTGPWKAEDYEVKRVKNLSAFKDDDSIDLGDKEFKVSHR
jgi:hypothetical protein